MLFDNQLSRNLLRVFLPITKLPHSHGSYLEHRLSLYISKSTEDAAVVVSMG